MAEEVILHTSNVLCLPQLRSAVASQSGASPLFLSLHSGSCDVLPFCKVWCSLSHVTPMPHNHIQAVLAYADSTLTARLCRARLP